MMHVIYAITLVGFMISGQGTLDDRGFDPALIAKFRIIWQKGYPLRVAPRGLARMNLDGLHAVIDRGPRSPADEANEERIRKAFAAGGFTPLPTDALRIRCGNDICETLFADLRPARQRMEAREPDRTGPVGGIAGRECRAAGGYPASVVGGLPGGSAATLSFFCIQRPAAETSK